MTVVLWHIELSHYSEKVRWALDYKDIPHERRVPMPGLHGIRAAVLTRGAQRRLPVIDLDGRRVWDSTRDHRRARGVPPRAAALPGRPGRARRGARARGLVRRASRRPDLRRLVWFHTLPDTDATAAALFTGESPARERLLRMTAPVSRRAVSADYEVNAATRRGGPRHPVRGDGPHRGRDAGRRGTSSATASASPTSRARRSSRRCSPRPSAPTRRDLAARGCRGAARGADGAARRRVGVRHVRAAPHRVGAGVGAQLT